MAAPTFGLVTATVAYARPVTINDGAMLISPASTADAVTDLDDNARTAVAQAVVAAWQPFTQQGRLILDLGFSVASGEE